MAKLRKQNIFNTTIYLIPFQTRNFGCAYLPTSSNVSSELNDQNIENNLHFNVKEQVQLFIKLAQLAGHPVIYDVLPQAGRFENIVLTNPSIARWYDINNLIKQITDKVDEIATQLEDKYPKEDIDITKDLYKQTLKSGAGNLSSKYSEIYEKIDIELENFKKEISEAQARKEEQTKIIKKVKN